MQGRAGDREGRPYGGLQGVRWGGTMWASSPTEFLVGADDPVRPGPITQHLVGQGPCALPGGAGKESPSHGFAMPAPFRQGGQGDGGCGLPHQ